MSLVARIRDGVPADTEAVLVLFDEATAWLAARGQRADPFSREEARVARVAEWAASGGLRLAEASDGTTLGAMALGARPPWVAPADRAEGYIELLVTARAHAGQDIGGELIRCAIQETRYAGAALLRVDCWRGAPELVEFYERQGFHPSGTFELGDWHGQVLSMEL